MKNVSFVMLGIVDGIFTDINSYLPNMLKETETCYKVLESAIEARGLPLFTMTLPECSKLLESSIRDNGIPTERPPYHGRYSKSDCRPVFLHGLWERIFDEHGHVLGDPCHFSVSALRQVYNFAKKWNADCARKYVDEAVKAYLRIEGELPRPRPDTWDSDVPRWSRPSGHPLWGGTDGSRPSRLNGLADDVIAYLDANFPLFGAQVPKTSYYDKSHWALFRVLCSKLSASLGFLDVWAIRPKHGPGAVSDKVKGFVKYDFRNWPQKLDNVFPADYFASHDYVVRTEDCSEPPCKLIAVPKTQKGPRLIAAEPTAHQWIQGGLQRWLEEAISRSPLGLSIDLRNQEQSRALALESSKSGAFATVDLSSASDRLSATLVDYIFQANESLLDGLHACRTRTIIIPEDLHPDGIECCFKLRKYAAQGSAVTFPIQTMIFTIIGHFALMLADGTRDCSLQSLRTRSHRLRVFGDDIIIDSSAHDHLVRLLTELGLKVNEGKSFHKGPFRESCGMDAFDGVDVTPAYFRTLHSPSDPSSLVSVIECSNNFYKKGWWNASDAVLKTVAPEVLERLTVTNKATGAIALFTFGKGKHPIGKIRWNTNLQRLEYLTFLLTQKEEKIHGRGESALLQYFIDGPKPIAVYTSQELLSEWSTGQALRPQLRTKLGWIEFIEP